MGLQLHFLQCSARWGLTEPSRLSTRACDIINTMAYVAVPATAPCLSPLVTILRLALFHSSSVILGSHSGFCAVPYKYAEETMDYLMDFSSEF